MTTSVSEADSAAEFKRSPIIRGGMTAMNTLEELFPKLVYRRVSASGFVIIDDYWTCDGAKNTVDGFRAAKSIRTEAMPDGRGGCSFTKPEGCE